MPVSPSTLNYSISKGIVKFTPTGGSERDLGNCPEVELTPSVTKLDHFSSRAGVKSKDKSVVTEKSLSIRIVGDEMTPDNLKLALMGGDITTNSDGNKEFGIFAESEITGSLRFDGTNDVGNRVSFVLPSVSFGPSSSFNAISDEWNQFEVTGEVLFNEDVGDFGTCEVYDPEEVTA